MIKSMRFETIPVFHDLSLAQFFMTCPLPSFSREEAFVIKSIPSFSTTEMAFGSR